MNLQEILYRLPAPARALAVNLYGWKLARNRFNKDFWKFYDYLLENLNLDTEEINKIYFSNLKQALIKARNCNYYNKLYREISFMPEAVSSFEDLKALPLIDKSIIRENFKDFVFKNDKDTVVHNTSGSTGEKFKFLINKQLLYVMNIAFIYRHYSLLGIRPYDRRVTIGGRLITKKPPFHIYNKFENQLLLSAHHVSDEKNIKTYLDEIVKFQPKFIQGHPSAIFVMADYINKKSYQFKHKLNGIFTTGESLDDNDQKYIEAAFDTKLLQQYGSGESIISAIQLPENNNYAVDIERGYIELVRNDETGMDEIVGTSFLNESFCFLRYRMNDYATASTRSSKTGLPEIFKKIIGRTDDYLKLKDERIILPVTLRMSLKPLLRTGDNYQIVQTDENKFELHLMGQNIQSKKDEAKSILVDLLGTNAYINTVKTDSLTTKGGKIRNVINEVKN